MIDTVIRINCVAKDNKYFKKAKMNLFLEGSLIKDPKLKNAIDERVLIPGVHKDVLAKVISKQDEKHVVVEDSKELKEQLKKSNLIKVFMKRFKKENEEN
jgi:hypothetical protein